jgi:hypothetical protein
LFFFPYAALNYVSRLSHGPNIQSFDARWFALPTEKINFVVSPVGSKPAGSTDVSNIFNALVKWGIVFVDVLFHRRK